MKKILIVTTSHNTFGNSGDFTGLWLEEFIEPFWVFHNEGFDVTVASILGGAVPIDPNSLSAANINNDCIDFIKEFPDTLNYAEKLADLDYNDFDAIFYPGGHGPMWDLSQSKVNAKIVSQSLAKGKIVSAVCHGPAALLAAVDEQGKSVLNGKNVTGFSNAEEKLAGGVDFVPFLLEDALKQRGANYTCSAPWASYTVTDGNLITGQNPASAKATAVAVFNALEHK